MLTRGGSEQRRRWHVTALLECSPLPRRLSARDSSQRSDVRRHQHAPIGRCRLAISGMDFPAPAREHPTRIRSELEALKAQLNAQTEIAVLQIRTDFERQAGVHNAAHGAFAAGQQAAMERKLKALDQLWGAFVRLRTSLPPIVGIMDVVTADEHRTVRAHPTFEKLTRDLSDEKLAKANRFDTELARPYVGDYMWALFSSYQTVMVRVVFLLQEGRVKPEKLNWQNDAHIKGLLTAALAPAELAEFERLKFGCANWLNRTFAAKIVSAAQKIVSGEEFGSEALKQAMQIQKRVEATNPTADAG